MYDTLDERVKMETKDPQSGFIKENLTFNG